MNAAKQITAFVDREFAHETAFLAKLVKFPSDNPPEDCVAHAVRAQHLLKGLGLKVEADDVPPKAAQAAGMKSVTDLIVRHRFGDGPTIALLPLTTPISRRVFFSKCCETCKPALELAFRLSH